MLGWVWDNLLSSTVGWVGLGTLALIICGAVAVYVPFLRQAAIGVAGVVIVGLLSYAKGQSNARARERERIEKTVKKIQTKYNEIDKRPDTVDDVKKRLKDGSF